MARIEIKVTRLAAHGTIHRYWKGCTCFQCKVARADYVTLRRQAVREGNANGIVSAERVRAHLLALRKSGIHTIDVAKFVGISYTNLRKVAAGTIKGMREKRARFILGIRSTPAGLIHKDESKNRIRF